MNRAEVIRLVADIVERWSHSDPVLDRYVDSLAMVQAEHAHAAVETWERDGQRFAPSAGDIIGRIADLGIDAPDWYAVVAELHRRQNAAGRRSWTADRTCPLARCNGQGLVIDDDARASTYCECREQMQVEIAARQSAHPVVAAFIAEVGQREIVDVLEGDRTAEAQVRTKYEAYVRNLRRSVTYTGVDAAGLPGLQRLEDERERRELPSTGRQLKHLTTTIDAGEVA